MMKNSSNSYLLQLIFFLIFNAWNHAAVAETEAIEIVSLSYFEDVKRNQSKEAAFALLQNKNVTHLDNAVFNLGSYDSHFWLLLTVQNDSLKPSFQKLLARVPYRKSLKAFLINDKEEKRFTNILNESHIQPFSTRENSFRLLNSEFFEVPSDNKKQILLSYETRGSTFLPLSVESQHSFSDFVNFDNVVSIWFYAVGLSLGLFFLLLTLIMKSHIGSYYAILFLFGLLLIATIDGFSFKFLWPNFPTWNQNAALYLLYFINALGFYFSAKVSTFKQNQALFRKITSVFIVTNIAMIFLIDQIGFSNSVALANILLLLMFVFNVLAISSWITSKRNRLTTVTMVIVTLFIGILAVLFFFSDELPDTVISYSNYITYLFIGAAIMTIISAQMLGLRKDHESALEEQLLSAKREAKMNKSLFEAEQNYSQIREVARLRQQQLATASHDIRQPLISLRSTMDSISHQQNPETKQQLHDAFDYMEQLCNSYLQESRPELEENNVPEEIISHSLAVDDSDEDNILSSEIELYPVSLILSTIKQMFENEAQSKGLEFNLVNSSYTTNLPPLVLMRIISNFTSNAIKNTSQGKVLVGCRRLSNGLRIEVHDTGHGIKKENIDKLQKIYAKGEGSSGEGLGLAIAQELAKQHDLRINVDSELGKGSCFSLTI